MIGQKFSDIFLWCPSSTTPLQELNFAFQYRVKWNDFILNTFLAPLIAVNVYRLGRGYNNQRLEQSEIKVHPLSHHSLQNLVCNHSEQDTTETHNLSHAAVVCERSFNLFMQPTAFLCSDCRISQRHQLSG